MKVESYIIKDWKNGISGVPVLENKNWLLIHEIATDYQLDGYALLRKSSIIGRSSGKWEKKVKRVLKLRNFKPTKPKKFKLTDLPSMLDQIVLKYGLFSFQDKMEKSIQVGLIDHFSKKYLYLSFIDANGILDQEYLSQYKLKSIRKVSFNTDYINAVKLLFASNYTAKKEKS